MFKLKNPAQFGLSPRKIIRMEQALSFVQDAYTKELRKENNRREVDAAEKAARLFSCSFQTPLVPDNENWGGIEN